ncbi:class I SAM-dependent methyltransferase [Parafrankia elaeagni]|uniref:class I SAM-dependent methyltransferase n=1 Tax=Parafrankia elaeagni TaxID=222534 RepID=UPI0012B5E2D2|nr:class I SAM-dependent methyltransferase [Parafrankia elaeagni]
MTVARRRPRLAAGRARALGVPTRGTTAPNRLRRVDRWLAAAAWSPLRRAADPLVVDVGFGASPVTTVEMYERLRPVRPDVRVVGLELAPERVVVAQAAARPPGLLFALGGFELAGHRPVVIRAMNVLRQYDERAVGSAWAAMAGRLSTGGMLVEGTCDEIGRRACWFALGAGGVPATLTFSAHLPSLLRPSDLAPRLPKALIARNVPGEDVHALLAAFDLAWERAAPRGTFGPRQRWIAAAALLRREGWPVLDGPRRWRLGELTVAWPPGPR